MTDNPQSVPCVHVHNRVTGEAALQNPYLKERFPPMIRFCRRSSGLSPQTAGRDAERKRGRGCELHSQTAQGGTQTPLLRLERLPLPITGCFFLE